MKMFLIFFVLFASISYGQNFPMNDIDLLFNKQLKVKPNNRLTAFSYSFYKNGRIDEISKTIRATDNYTSVEFDSILVGSIFTLMNYTRNNFQEKYILKLKNPRIGVIYYKYLPTRPDIFAFEVIGGLDFPDNYFSKKITKTYDKFTGLTTYETMSIEGISFKKVKGRKFSKSYIDIKFSGNIGTTIGMGAIILLENNKRINFPNALIGSIENGHYFLDVYMPSYILFTDIELSPYNVRLLRKNKITDIRLVNSDKTYSEGKIIIKNLNSLTK